MFKNISHFQASSIKTYLQSCQHSAYINPLMSHKPTISYFESAINFVNSKIIFACLSWFTFQPYIWGNSAKLHCIWSQNLKPTKALLRKAQALSDITAWPISCQQKGAGVFNWILPVTWSSSPTAMWLFLLSLSEELLWWFRNFKESGACLCFLFLIYSFGNIMMGVVRDV